MPVIRVADRPASPVPAGVRTSVQVLIGSDEAPHFLMRRFQIDAGGHMPPHTNSVEHEQYVLEGRAEIRIGDETHVASAGDVVFIPAGVPHAYRTLGDEAFAFLCLVPKQPDEVELVEDA